MKSPSLHASRLALMTALVALSAAEAQPCAAQAVTRSDSSDDKALQEQVRDALHADPYFYDEHVTVAVEDGKIVLHGFVFSDWDLRNAIRIARQAAEGRLVIDELSIKEGGKR